MNFISFLLTDLTKIKRWAILLVMLLIAWPPAIYLNEKAAITTNPELQSRLYFWAAFAAIFGTMLAFCIVILIMFYDKWREVIELRHNNDMLLKHGKEVNNA